MTINLYDGNMSGGSSGGEDGDGSSNDEDRYGVSDDDNDANCCDSADGKGE